MVAIAIANGVLRVLAYGRLMPELQAHQLSTLTGMLMIGAYAWVVLNRWPTASIVEAWTVGVTWALLTVAFEFGFGRFIMGHAWGRLLHDYDLSAGRVWVLFLMFVACVPAWIHRRRHRASR